MKIILTAFDEKLVSEPLDVPDNLVMDGIVKLPMAGDLVITDVIGNELVTNSRRVGVFRATGETVILKTELLAELFDLIDIEKVESLPERKQVGKYLTIKETAKLIGVHEETLRRWDRSGYFKAKHLGERKDRKYTLEMVEEFLKSI